MGALGCLQENITILQFYALVYEDVIFL